MKNIKRIELKNGIQFIHYPVSSPISYIGLLINTGSRDELKNELGAAHMMEHMLFKSTKRRNTNQILNYIDEIGGELNAYTTKENTFIYASLVSDFEDRAFDLISDITFESVFPPKELEKEKAVVMDEINSYKEDPSEEIGDQFDELLFNSHGLGTPILGTEKSVASFTANKLIKFHRRTYTTDQMVICYIGASDLKSVLSKVEKYFGELKTTKRKFKREKFRKYKPFHVSLEKDNHSCHAMLGNIAYDVYHKNRIPFFILNNLLGGPSLNSRLSLNIREKYGYTYFIESNYSAFEDTGMWWIYYATEKKNFEKTGVLIQKELQKLRDKKLSETQMFHIKRQVKGQLAIANENYSNLLHTICRNFLFYNHFESLEKTYHKIDGITSNQLWNIANDVFDPKNTSLLQYISSK